MMYTTMQLIFAGVSLVALLLNLTSAMESLGFRRISALDGLLQPGAFEIQPYSGEPTPDHTCMICSGRCMYNGCVSFVYVVAYKTCHFYDWPLTGAVTGGSLVGESFAYTATGGDSSQIPVLSLGSHLYHVIPERKEAWLITLRSDYNWTGARDACAEKGGVLLPIHDSTPYDRFNALDAAYPGILRTSDADYYNIGASDIATDDYRNLDGTPVNPLQWIGWEPDNSGQCLIIWHTDVFAPDYSFKLGDIDCAHQTRYICLFSSL